MDYILELRQYVGHRPIQTVGAVVLVLDNQNRLLMLRRSDSDSWGLPGGATELGEVVEHAAKRETLEETNLEVGAMSLFGVFSGPEFYYKYPNGDEVYNISIVYLSQDWQGEVRLNEEHTEYGWFKVGEIPQELSQPIKLIIEQYKNTFLPPDLGDPHANSRRHRVDQG